MKWLAVIGTREATPQMRRDVERRVQEAAEQGWGIVSGGSTGVDTAATMAAVACGAKARVYLPTSLRTYEDSLLRRAGEGKCVAADAEETISHLYTLTEYDPKAVIEPAEATDLTPEAFYARNERILRKAARVAAFYLEGNATASKLPAGTLLTVERAHELGLPVELSQYHS